MAQLSALIGLVVMSRALGPTGLGIVLSALTLQAYLLAIGSFGARSVVVQEGAKEPRAIERLASAYWALGASGGTLVLFATFAAVHWGLAPSAEESRLLLVVALANLFAVLSPLPLFEARHFQAIPATAAAATEILALAALLTFRDALSPLGVGAIFAVKWLLASAVQWAVWIRIEGLIPRPPTTAEVVRLGRRALPVLGATVLALAPQNAGVLSVRLLFGAEGAGQYGIAQAAMQAFLVIALLGIGMVQPHLAGPSGDDPLFRRRALVATSVALGILAVAVFGAAAASVRWLLPASFSPATTTLALVLPAGMLLALSSLMAFLAIRSGLERQSWQASFLAFSVWALATALLVPRAGPTGAALAALSFAAARVAVLLFALRGVRALGSAAFERGAR